VSVERSEAPAEIFFSYSHKDERLRDQLETHLRALEREGLVSGWHDRRITAGDEWKGAIDERLKTAKIILLLLSSDFIASDYCHDVELSCAMERHERHEARVIPVILRPCDWQHTIFARLQALPTNGRPVLRWTSRDEAFLNVVEGIRKALKADGTESSSSKAPDRFPPIVAPPAVNALHQLPAPPADFTGRADELADLIKAVKTGGVTISGLQGLGGVGKTALALKLAEQLKADYPNAQFYLDLKGVTQPLAPKEAMAHVVRAYHPAAQLPDDEAHLAGLYRSVLDGKRALLLMDNARDAAQVQPLLPPASCLLLVTSRQHFRLPGMVSKDLNEMPPGDACALLKKIAPRLAKESQDQVSQFATLCGHLPLALEKVASALHVRADLSADDYIRRLADARKRLKLTATDAALQSSYDLLREDLRQRFRALAVFPESFDLAAAAAVWATEADSAQDSLGELFSYSLVGFDQAAARYRLHDLVRLFADQRLDEQERATAQPRHAGHYLKVLGAADDLYLKGGEWVTKGLALFDAEWSNIQAGQAWAAKHAPDDDNAADSCWRYQDAGVYCLVLRQHPRERIRWLEAALPAARRLKRRNWEGNSLGNLGNAYQSLGEYRRAIEYHEQSLEIARKIGDRRGEGAVLGNLGIAYSSLGEYRRAIEYLEQRLKIAREIGDRRGEGNALGNLGNAYSSLGEYRRAIEYHEQNLAIARKIGDRRGEGNALGNLGNAYSSLGEYRRAIEYHEQHLEIAREIGDRRGEGNALGNLGNAYKNLSDYRRAIEHYEQGLVIDREIGDRDGEGTDLWNSALALDPLGDRKDAIIRAEAALQIFEAIESPYAGVVRERLADWREEEKGRGHPASE
jgi:tetratricopeptide (TPR) repeat protein